MRYNEIQKQMVKPQRQQGILGRGPWVARLRASTMMSNSIPLDLTAERRSMSQGLTQST